MQINRLFEIVYILLAKKRVTKEICADRDLSGASENLHLNAYEGQEEVTIKLRIEQERAYRVFDDFHESMVEKQPDGSFLITLSWPEDPWLYGFILSFGNYIEVIEPEYLRNIIKEEAQNIAKKYL